MSEEDHKDSDLDMSEGESRSPLSNEENNQPEQADSQIESDQEPLSEGDTLRVELEQARSTVEKHKDEALRAFAELDNVRKRAERDVAAAHKFGMEKFINELLPVKDSLDLGFDAANSAEDVETIREGMALTLKMFESALEKGGVQSINPQGGEVFNPEFHQAMMMEESQEVDAGQILRVMQKGYSLNERLLRPAMVIVAKKAVD